MATSSFSSFIRSILGNEQFYFFPGVLEPFDNLMRTIDPFPVYTHRRTQSFAYNIQAFGEGILESLALKPNCELSFTEPPGPHFLCIPK